jgi:BASS family bile acid:Na+ symporter
MNAVARFLMFLFVVTVMLAIGLQAEWRDLRSSAGAQSLLARSLIANFLVVPALGLLIRFLVPMPADASVGFLLLALTPGGMSALQFTTRTKSALFYAGTLTVILAVLSVVFTPALAALLLPPGYEVSVPYLHILGLMGLYLLLPLFVGVCLRDVLGGPAAKLGKVAGLVATLTFFAFVVYVMAVRKAAIAALSPAVVGAMIAFILGSMIIGWLLGGPDRETRAVLASASSVRGAAVCLLIAGRSFPGTDVAVAVVAFSALMVLPNMLFTIYRLIARSRRKNRPEPPLARLHHIRG